MRGLRLPESMREELARPHGKLYRGKGERLLLEVEEIPEGKMLFALSEIW